jgi:hypothetical protein
MKCFPVLPIGAIAFSLFLLIASLWAGYLSKRYFAIVFCLWGVYVLSSIVLALKVISMAAILALHPTVALGMVAGLLIPLAASSVAPLAFAAHRHG